LPCLGDGAGAVSEYDCDNCSARLLCWKNKANQDVRHGLSPDSHSFETDKDSDTRKRER
jgi:hypothetical protein